MTRGIVLLDDKKLAQQSLPQLKSKSSHSYKQRHSIQLCFFSTRPLSKFYLVLHLLKINITILHNLVSYSLSALNWYLAQQLRYRRRRWALYASKTASTCLLYISVSISSTLIETFNLSLFKRALINFLFFNSNSQLTTYNLVHLFTSSLLLSVVSFLFCSKSPTFCSFFF